MANEQTKSSPLENFFNVEKNTTDVVNIEHTSVMTEVDSYDEKDEEIERDFQIIYDKALSAYDALQNEILDAESRSLPRLIEVSTLLLNTALNANAQKMKIKELKDKLDIQEKKISVSDKNNAASITANITDLVKEIRKIVDTTDNVDKIDPSKIINGEFNEEKND